LSPLSLSLTHTHTHTHTLALTVLETVSDIRGSNLITAFSRLPTSGVDHVPSTPSHAARGPDLPGGFGPVGVLRRAAKGRGEAEARSREKVPVQDQPERPGE
jgi:hypothetical protein